MRIHLPVQIAAVVLAAGFGERLVGALHDALAADVDPRAGRHLAVHHEALAIELVEVLPGRPVRHEVRVGDQHARGVGMRLEHADGFSRLDEQRFVGFQRAQARDDLVVALPVARGLADAAVDHEVFGPLRDLGIEVVHEHAQRGFGEPALGRERSVGAGSVWPSSPPPPGGRPPSPRPPPPPLLFRQVSPQPPRRSLIGGRRRGGPISIKAPPPSLRSFSLFSLFAFLSSY